MKIWVVTDEHGTAISAHTSAALAVSSVKYEVQEEKYREISDIVTGFGTNEEKSKQIAKLDKIYNDAFTRYEQSYQHYCEKDELTRIPLDEYDVWELELEGGNE